MNLLPTRIGPLQFLGWLVAGIVSIFVIFFVIGTTVDGLNAIRWTGGLAVAAWFVFYVGVLAPARLRDMGQNPLWALGLLVPLVALVVLIFMLVTPTKRTT